MKIWSPELSIVGHEKMFSDPRAETIIKIAFEICTICASIGGAKPAFAVLDDLRILELAEMFLEGIGDQVAADNAPRFPFLFVHFDGVVNEFTNLGMRAVKRVAAAIEDNAVKVKAACEPTDFTTLLKNQALSTQCRGGADTGRTCAQNHHARIPFRSRARRVGTER